VVAPATPAAGAAKLAQRFAGGMDVGVRPDLRAGFDVAALVDQPTLVAPRLIDHARVAAAAAAIDGAGAWLREYRET